jgi:anti-sigma factor RsiW
MNQAVEHPEDFSPFLDRDFSDPKYEEIRKHVDGCARCREEIRGWQSLDALFRTEEATIDVPPFQWRRIAIQLQTPVPAGMLDRFRAWMQLRRLAWSAALATLVLGALTFTGLEYQNNLEEKQLLLAISESAAVEEQRAAAAENPFRTAAAANDNSNPFAVRR